jgi:hypothetical protein
MTTLGVACTSSYAFLSLADGEELVEDAPARLSLRDGLSEAERLPEFCRDVARALRDVAPAAVVLLRAGPGYQDTHNGWTDRIAMETLVRLECARASVPSRYVSHQAVQGALGLSGRGGLVKLGKDRLTRSGLYWTDGRHQAALAAVGAELGA